MSSPVTAVIWCSGPASPWSDLTPIQRLAIIFRRGFREDEQRWLKTSESLFSSAVVDFGMCGPQTVELDTSEPNDIWPAYCPVCGTDTNWDMDTFWREHPEYKGVYEED